MAQATRKRSVRARPWRRSASKRWRRSSMRRRGPRTQLAAGRRRPAQRAGHLLEGVAEDVVEQVGGAFERRQLLEQHQEGQRQRVRLLGCRLLLDHHRLGQPRAGVRDAGGPGRVELVEAEAGHDGDEIGAHRFDGTVTAAQPTDGGVLDDVLGVGGTAQHAVGDAEQQRAPFLEGRRVGLGVRRRHPWRRPASGSRSCPRNPGCAGRARR